MTKTIGNPLSWSAKEIGVVGQHLGSVAGHIGHWCRVRYGRLDGWAFDLWLAPGSR